MENTYFPNAELEIKYIPLFCILINVKVILFRM